MPASTELLDDAARLLEAERVGEACARLAAGGRLAAEAEHSRDAALALSMASRMLVALGRVDEAGQLLDEAGAHAAAVGGVDEFFRAHAAYARARRAKTGRSDDASLRAQALGWRADLARATGGALRAGDLYGVAAEAHAAGGDRAAAVRDLAARAGCLRALDDNTGADAALEHAATVAGEDAPARARVLLGRAFAEALDGHAARAFDTADAAGEACPPEADPDVFVETLRAMVDVALAAGQDVQAYHCILAGRVRLRDAVGDREASALVEPVLQAFAGRLGPARLDDVRVRWKQWLDEQDDV